MVRATLNVGFMNLWKALISYGCIIGLNYFTMSMNLGIELVTLEMKVCVLWNALGIGLNLNKLCMLV